LIGELLTDDFTPVDVYEANGAITVTPHSPPAWKRSMRSNTVFNVCRLLS
jgi:hypothetical protein